LIVTSAAEPAWIRPLATLRPRGIGTQVLYLDPREFLRHEIVAAGRSVEEPGVSAELTALEQASRRVHHSLAEFDVRTCMVPPAIPLGEVLVG
jgi:hypothetical protein